MVCLHLKSHVECILTLNRMRDFHFLFIWIISAFNSIFGGLMCEDGQLWLMSSTEQDASELATPCKFIRISVLSVSNALILRKLCCHIMIPSHMISYLRLSGR